MASRYPALGGKTTVTVCVFVTHICTPTSSVCLCCSWGTFPTQSTCMPTPPPRRPYPSWRPPWAPPPAMCCSCTTLWAPKLYCRPPAATHTTSACQPQQWLCHPMVKLKLLWTTCPAPWVHSPARYMLMTAHEECNIAEKCLPTICCQLSCCWVLCELITRLPLTCCRVLCKLACRWMLVGQQPCQLTTRVLQSQPGQLQDVSSCARVCSGAYFTAGSCLICCIHALFVPASVIGLLALTPPPPLLTHHSKLYITCVSFAMRYGCWDYALTSTICKNATSGILLGTLC